MMWTQSPRLRRTCLLALPAAVAVLGGCASMEITRIGSGGPEAAFELRGTNLIQLEAEARRLCPRGYEVFRSWQHYESGENQTSLPARWLGVITGVVSEHERQAQLAIGCRVPTA